MWLNILLVIDIILALTLVGLVLLQQGKGADAGAAFGSGASATVFGARGAATFLSQMTKWVAILWFSTTLGLVYLTRQVGSADDAVLDAAVPAATTAAPATSAPAMVPTTLAPSPSGAPTTAPAPSTAAPAGTGGG
jgi:preprotein translocase subunit SecG